MTHIGYSSFDLKNVFKWKQECFEIVKERTGKKYKVKPKEYSAIEAFRYDGDLKDSKGNYCVPVWAEEAFEMGVLYYDSFESGGPCELFIVDANIMPIHVMVGDYIVKNDFGRIYSMTAESFGNTFEVVENGKQSIQPYE